MESSHNQSLYHSNATSNMNTHATFESDVQVTPKLSPITFLRSK